MKSIKLGLVALVLFSGFLFAGQEHRIHQVMIELMHLSANKSKLDQTSCNLYYTEIVNNWRPQSKKYLKKQVTSMALLTDMCYFPFSTRMFLAEKAAEIRHIYTPYMDLPSPMCVQQLFKWDINYSKDRAMLYIAKRIEYQTRVELIEATARSLHRCRPWLTEPKVRFMNRILRNGYN